MEAIIASVVTGVLSLIGCIITNISGQKKIYNQTQISQAVTDAKLDELTREVRVHNGFAQRVPVLEEQIKIANHRISELEKKH